MRALFPEVFCGIPQTIESFALKLPSQFLNSQGATGDAADNNNESDEPQRHEQNADGLNEVAHAGSSLFRQTTRSCTGRVKSARTPRARIRCDDLFGRR